VDRLPTLTTPRLRLRLWQDEDSVPFAAMNADPRVREYYPSVLTPAESDAAMGRIRAHFERHGFGNWALELCDHPGLIGYAGIAYPSFDAPSGPCVEIGWRLAFAHWGRGYATEAAEAVLGAAFEAIGLEEIVSFAAVGNLRSRRVMEKIGMSHDPADDFDHPSLIGHHLSRHVLYRLRRTDWQMRSTKPAIPR
jgi:RimJ/RimL family protein N-acetyltransferase